MIKKSRKTGSSTETIVQHLPQTGDSYISVNTNLIPVRRGGYRVLSSQCDTTSSNDQKDGHLKVPEVHHIMTRSTHTGESRVETT